MRKLVVIAAVWIAAVPASAQDTITVQADNPPVWGDATLVEELRVGTLAGDERYTFGLVVGVAEAPDGTIWVADRMAAGLRRYSADGTYLNQVGQRGDGPGEFQYLMDLRLTPEGEISAWDPMGQRITFFDLAGDVVGTTRVVTGGVMGNHQPYEVDSDGHHYIAWREERAFWMQVDREGAVQDTIWYPSSARVGHVHPIRTMAVVSPDRGLIVGRNDEMAFTWTLADGRVARVTRRAEPVEYTRDERTQAQERENVYSERWGDAPREIPRQKPLWSEFDVDAEGRIWVRRHVPPVRVQESESERERREQIGNPEIRWAEPAVYDVLDPRGQFLGSVRVPNSTWASPVDRLDLVLAHADVVWVVEKGDFGEDYVVRYRITPGPN